MTDKRNFGLDMARAAAISFVFLCHLLSNTINASLGAWWYMGYFGVDIFFALSGFLIGGILLQVIEADKDLLSPSQTRRFLVRRWFRTVPLYLVMLLFDAAAGRYILGHTVTLDWRYFLWLQNFNNFPLPFFVESWSLCIEEWFYFSFSIGLCLYTLLVHNRKIAIRYKVLVFTLCYILFFTWVRLQFSPYDRTEIYILLYRLDTIAYGVLAVILYRYFRVARYKGIISIVGIMLTLSGIVLYMLGLRAGKIYIVCYNLTGSGLALCVLAVKIYSDTILHFLHNRVVTWVSKISYSIYLTNMIVIFLLIHFLRPAMNKWLLTLITIGATLLLSHLTYHYIEQPFLRYRDNHFKQGRKPLPKT